MSTLDFVIPAVIIGYAVFLMIRMARNRKRGCVGGCSGCPMAASCAEMKAQPKKEQEKHEP